MAGGEMTIKHTFCTPRQCPITKHLEYQQLLKEWLPLVDLFRNCKVEIQFTLLELKRLFEVFNLSLITHAH